MTTGRYVISQQWGQHWVVQDLATNPPTEVGRPHPTKHDAQIAADRLNTPAPRPRAQQTALFEPQEV